ncbi:hypothetical protein [Halapricum desulfuricans]|uniref:Uncharacterized protein n=1 Tax=Halapricum desulfuricans TaxID=2841257 RepID=A0A897NL14_9EURY|nr:hypothetical protein [Halapricum desulfuricans]QSG15170.1 hypothetical protein HSEST_1646 [Halapricum desulfuricans]
MGLVDRRDRRQPPRYGPGVRTTPAWLELDGHTDYDALSPYGSASVQNRGGTAYVAIARRLVEHCGIEPGTSLSRAFHPESSALIIPLNDDVNLFE